jgi:hypothetical protein
MDRRHRIDTVGLATLLGVVLLGGGVTAASAQDASPTPVPAWSAPLPGAPFDYQIGGDYELPDGVEVVSRDWFIGTAPDDIYAICYVNAFQTQDDEEDVDRPDERSSWPADLVLLELGDDPNWGGEYLIDISTPEKRAQAAAWIEPMVATCAEKGFDAVEFDNLDSWTRFDETPVEDQVPFERDDSIAYAELLADLAHAHGLAAAQKNTVELEPEIARERIGFDFVIAEECGTWDECQDYVDVYGDHVIAIEYVPEDFAETCEGFGDRLSVVLRDVDVTQPGSDTYQYARCPEAPAAS